MPADHPIESPLTWILFLASAAVLTFVLGWSSLLAVIVVAFAAAFLLASAMFLAANRIARFWRTRRQLRDLRRRGLR